MSDPRLSDRTDARAAASALLARTPPVLAEVRFPGAATAPDWYLLEEEDELNALLERLGTQAELHLSSVWDLTNAKGAIRLTK